MDFKPLEILLGSSAFLAGYCIKTDRFSKTWGVKRWYPHFIGPNQNQDSPSGHRGACEFFRQAKWRSILMELLFLAKS